MRHLAWLPIPAAFTLFALVFEANGPTLTTLICGALALFLLSLAFAVRRLAVSLLIIGASFILGRLINRPATALQVCFNDDCGSGVLRWQRIFDEREVARAGVTLSMHLKDTPRLEAERFTELLDASWERMPAGFRGVPNPMLFISRPGRVTTLRYRAPGDAKRPAIVFLHGFGGLLTPYLESITRATGGTYDIIAPVLDPSGYWWSAHGLAVVEEVLQHLPPDVDRVFLLGLSNGGVGASAVLQDAHLTKRLSGVVLISGVGELKQRPRVPLLMISGKRDSHFTYSSVSIQAYAAEALGAAPRTVWLQADHFLILTHTAEWGQAFARFAQDAASSS